MCPVVLFSFLSAEYPLRRAGERQRETLQASGGQKIMGKGRRGENGFGGQAGSRVVRKGGKAGGACGKGSSEPGWVLGGAVGPVWVA